MSSKVVVREETPEDVDTVRSVVASAFGGERVAGLLDGLRESVAWLGLSYVAVEGGKAGHKGGDGDGGDVVAHVCFTRGWVDAPERLIDVLVLSPLAVRPDRQRTGLGSALVRATLDLLRDRPEPMVFLEGSPDYYSRLGFVAGHELGFSAPSVRIPEPAFQVATLSGHDPDQTGALVYPDVFWRHDCVGLRPER